MEPVTHRPLGLPARLGQREDGEGVISAAIVVLIMAFLGVAMWLAFNNTFDNASARIDDQVSQIGAG